MKYKKIEKNNYNLHIIKTNRFKTITVKVNFKRKLVKEEITKRNVLVNALFESTAKYPTRRLLEIKTEELYNLGYHGVNYASGKFTVFCFEMSFLNPKYTEKSMYDESFTFLRDLIYEPNVKNGAFVQENYELAYNTMHDYLKTLKEDTNLYSQIRMMEEMDDSLISYRHCGYLEDLDKINSESLYSYYKDIIENDAVDIFVIGDINPNEIEKLIDKYFSFSHNCKLNESHFYNHQTIEKEERFTKEKVDKEQSTLVLGLKIDPLTDFERKYALSIYNYLLGGSTESNLFKVVREENSLCYYITSSCQPLINLCIIKAGINAKDSNKTVDLIKKELKKIVQGDFDITKITNAKETYLNSLVELEDNPDNIISLYNGMEYLDADDIKTRKKKIKEVTKEDIIAIAKKVHLNTIFLLEGSDLDEK